MIVIVDYGVGNIGSLKSALKYIGSEFDVSRCPGDLKGQSHIILPGVGSFESAMRNLTESGYKGALQNVFEEGITKILGICVGLHLMCKSSEESNSTETDKVVDGLGWLPVRVKKLPVETRSIELGEKLPHMGWNLVVNNNDDGLFKQISNEEFYFLHSYYLDCLDSEMLTSTTHHGLQFPASIESGNVYGTQFHPERSHNQGLKILTNFTVT